MAAELTKDATAFCFPLILFRSSFGSVSVTLAPAAKTNYDLLENYTAKCNSDGLPRLHGVYLMRGGK